MGVDCAALRRPQHPPNRRPHLEGVGRGGHVVDADDAGPVVHAGQGGRDTGGHTIAHRAAGHLTEGTLARPAHQQRIPEGQQFPLAGEQRQVVGGRLAEANARVEGDALRGHPGRPHGIGPLPQERRHLGHDVAVDRLLGLHGLGLAPHVHQAHTTGRVRGHHLQGARLAERRDVVDDVHAQVERRAHHAGLVGVDGQRHAEPGGVAQHRQHAGQFVLERDRVRTRAAGFPADVEDVGPLLDQPLAMAQRGGRGGMLPAVGERVRGDVDDAHHPGSAQVDAKTSGLPEHRAEEAKRKQGPQ